MKTYTLRTYGQPEEVISLEEVEKPVPKQDEVLIQVKAAPINDYDWCVTTGTPFAYRLYFGLSKPKPRFQRLGMEVAGIIKAIGPDCSKFRVGDEVYGDISNGALGSLGEYICTSEQNLVAKPSGMSFEDACAIPHASMLAYEAMVDLGHLGPNQKLLINGAGGGMGTFAIQVAKTYENVEITAVDSAAKANMLKTQGAHQIIDYRKEDFTKNGQQYDLILDPRTNRSPWKFLKSLKKGGRYVTVGGRSGKLIQLLLLKGLIRLFTGKHVLMLGLKPNQHLNKINAMYNEGIIKPVIDGPHPFEEVPQCIQYFGDAKHQGKIVISIP